MKSKKATIVFFILVATVIMTFLITGYPIVIKSRNPTGMLNEKFSDSAVFNPLEKVDLTEGKWVIYLMIDRYDFKKLPSELTHYKLWEATSIQDIDLIKSKWNFKPTGGDVATISSSVIIIHDGLIVFESGIVIERDFIGLQSQEFGWAEPSSKNDFRETLRVFKKVRSPLVIL